jgi:hypothetical protein
MTFDRAWLRAALIVASTLAFPGLLHAGGVTFTDDDNTSDEGPSYFGFVREVDGPGISDAKVTAALKDRGALVTRTDIMGVYKIPGFGKDINPTTSSSPAPRTATRKRTCCAGRAPAATTRIRSKSSAISRKTKMAVARRGGRDPCRRH